MDYISQLGTIVLASVLTQRICTISCPMYMSVLMSQKPWFQIVKYSPSRLGEPSFSSYHSEIFIQKIRPKNDSFRKENPFFAKVIIV